MRRSIIKRYLSISPDPAGAHACLPDYLKETDIIASHILRSKTEIKGENGPKTTYAYTRARDYPLVGEGGTLSEISIGVMAETLLTRANLGVAAGFFSSTVACIDDYIDCEGDYDQYGERLYWASHAYRDLLDMALDEEVRLGRLSAPELHEIRERLFEVIKTLVESERTEEAEAYLYRKSCGDKVIGVLFPVAGADESVRSMCSDIGRLIGEAGQLLDDVMDYDLDYANNNKNYIIMSGTDSAHALDAAERKILRAREAGESLGSRPIVWILDTMRDIVVIFRGRLESGHKLGSYLLGLSRPLSSLLPKGVPADRFLLWF
jgi:hypothetical protein